MNTPFAGHNQRGLRVNHRSWEEELESAERTLVAMSASLPSVSVSCPACRGTAPRAAFRRGGFQVLECESCHTLYVTPRPTEDALLSVYRCHPELGDFENEAFLSAGGDNAAEIRYRVRRVLEVQRAGRLLDVGCGRAEFLSAAGAHFETRGVDVSPRHGQVNREEDVFAGRLEDARYEPESFDVITLVEVLEHLFDPGRTLREIYRVLKRRGVLIMQTGDASSLLARLCRAKWPYLQPPIHLNCFSRRGLMRLTSDTGFRVVKAWSFGRAPERLPGSRLLSNPEVFRSAMDIAARIGLVGQMYCMAKTASV